jgi:hypothetical protein
MTSLNLFAEEGSNVGEDKGEKRDQSCFLDFGFLSIWMFYAPSYAETQP